MSSARLTYRPYLDGLRALAVLAVFVFHATPTALPGGFIGVDVFFVLSGYLITRLLVEEWEADGSIALSRFYARRSRRLVPAVALLVLVVAMVEGVWGSVLDAGNRVRESVATLFYVANWNLVVSADDYFAEGDASPLRHAWSLAVEEQFYLLWPLLLLAALAWAARRGRSSGRRTALVVAVAAALASVAAMLVVYEPNAVARAYYGTDTRVFQPLVGAVLGIARAGTARPTDVTRRWADVVAGVCLVLLAVIAFGIEGSDALYYRGGALAVAVVATVLVDALERSPGGLVERALSTRWVVALGVISYGFYLWHWPVLQWVTSPEGASFAERRLVNLVQLALTTAIAVASHRLVEDPIRRGQFRPLAWPRPAATVVAGVVWLGLTAGAAVALIDAPDLDAPLDVAQPAVDFVEPDPGADDSGADEPTGGDDASGGAPPVPELSRAARDQLAIGAARDRSFRPCPEDPRPCLKVDGGPDAPVVVLIGDSTAQAYDPALEVLAEQHGFSYVQAAVGGCPIGRRLLATGIAGERHKPSNIECFEELPSIYEEVLTTWPPTLVLATSSNEDSPHVVDDEVVEPGTPEHVAETEARLRETIELLTTTADEFVFIDILPPGVGVQCLEDSQPTDQRCVRERNPTSIETVYNDLFGRLADDLDRVERISVTDQVCDPDACPLIRDGIVVRYDGGHLTGTASRLLAPVLQERLAGVGIELDALG